MMKKKSIIGSISVVIIVLVVILIKSYGSKEQDISFETVKAKLGSVSNSITATGTIEAIKTVEVGTQVSGEIRKIYVDYNTQVKAGQLLAELDRKPLATTLTISEAALDDAKAEMNYQTANYNRIKALWEKQLVAESDYDLALYNFERAKTTLKTAQLNYDKAKINLEYAYIYSPIDGVVLSRAVDEGQTVAASFNTPTLFTIANDLTRMQVEASIDEADIGQVKNGQRVDFTVDAYPEDKFAGKITQIRLEPVVTSNVVTYTVIVEAPNPDKKLMPGMTASITVYVEEANNVLTIASKALHFKPDPMIMAAYAEKETGKSNPKDFSKKGIKPQPGDSIHAFNRTGHQQQAVESTATEVCIKKGVDIHPVRIVTGINNDIDVQVISGLKEGDEVVISMNSGNELSVTADQQAARSPFMPRPPSRRTRNR